MGDASPAHSHSHSNVCQQANEHLAPASGGGGGGGALKNGVVMSAACAEVCRPPPPAATNAAGLELRVRRRACGRPRAFVCGVGIRASWVGAAFHFVGCVLLAPSQAQCSPTYYT